MLNYKNQNFGKWGSDVTGHFMDIVSIENISEMATLNIRQCKPRTRTKWNSCKKDDMHKNIINEQNSDPADLLKG